MDYATVAESLVEKLAPDCERIEVAGSIRRGKADPKDIEIVAIPKFERWSTVTTLFGDSEEASRNLLDEVLEEWLQGDVLHHRLDKNGRQAWGDRFKRLVYSPPPFYSSENRAAYPLDLFSVLPPAQWGVIFAIRTGPAEFSHSLVTSRVLGGAMPSDMRVKDGALYYGGQIMNTPEEADFFKAIGLPCWPPEERSGERLMEWKREIRRKL